MDESELLDLGLRFDESVATYRAMVGAIPEGVSVETEHAAIDAAAVPVRALAERIADAQATSDEGHAVKAKAHAFLAGQEAK